MKKLLLILLCVPLLGLGQSQQKQILNLNKKIESLNENILHQKFINDSLRNRIDSLEDYIVDGWEYDAICGCQAAGGEDIVVKYWDNRTMKYYGWEGGVIGMPETPKYEWHRNGKLSTIYIYGGCESDHNLIETIDFDENGEYLDLYLPFE